MSSKQTVKILRERIAELRRTMQQDSFVDATGFTVKHKLYAKMNPHALCRLIYYLIDTMELMVKAMEEIQNAQTRT